jgi:hypothetical protein
MSEKLKILALALQMNEPVFVRYAKDVDGPGIVASVTEAIGCPVDGEIDLATEKDMSVIGGRYIWEKEDRQSSVSEENFTYFHPREEDLILPPWMEKHLRREGVPGTLILNNFLLASTSVMKTGTRLMMRRADRFSFPKNMRVVAISPNVPVDFVSQGDPYRYVHVFLEKKDEGVLPDLPVLRTSWTMFIGKWRESLVDAIGKNPAIMDHRIGRKNLGRDPGRAMSSWTRAIRMMAAVDSTEGESVLMRKSAEACVGPLIEPEWNSLLAAGK